MSEQIKCVCGERYFDAKCFVTHYQQCQQAARAQGRQEVEPVAKPQVMGRVAHLDDGSVICYLNSIGRSLPDNTALYADTHLQPDQQGSVPEFNYDHPTYCEIIERIAEATHRLLIAAGHDAETALDMDEALEANIYKNIDMVALELEGSQQGSVPEEWRECLLEMVQAMHDYEMSVDEDAPYKHRAMMDRAHVLLAATPQPEGDGWMLLPKTATTSMCEAGCCVPNRSGQSEVEWMAEIYEAMTDAAPQPPIEQESKPHHRSSEQ